MNRIKDYAGFAGWFAGLGYIALWPVTSSDFISMPFGASIFCHDGGPSLTNTLCNSAYALQLPPGLHVLGFLSALFVTVRLLAHSIRRARRAAARGKPVLMPPVPLSHAATALRRLHKPPPPHRHVKPRAHFGLRGAPH